MTPLRRISVPAGTVYQLKVTVEGSDPPIWRRLLVPADVSLVTLHRIVQGAMGWNDSHLHQFILGDRRFSDPRIDESGDLKFEDERKSFLSEVVGVGETLQYQYDFGHGWVHEIVVEESQPPDRRLRHPACIGGARACPPDDVGGMAGYEELLVALAHPDHPQHDESHSRIGREFDPERFDVNAANQVLRAM